MVIKLISITISTSYRLVEIILHLEQLAYNLMTKEDF